MSKQPKKRSQATQDILDGMAELESWVRQGLTIEEIKRRHPDRVRVRVQIAAPGQYSPKRIKEMRKRIAVSQADFANLLGVSRILVQSWEQGVRQPSPLARRLLDTIADDPAAWLATLRRTPQHHTRRAG